MAKYTQILLLVLLLTTSTIGICEAQESASIQIEGFVYRPDGSPLQDASIRLWGFYLEGEVQTDSEGHYKLQTSVHCGRSECQS
jgi:protocatechuate 3,4-dioxygenase beta subunit